MCTPRGSGDKSLHANGTGGIDNAFGSTLLPLLMFVDDHFGEENNARGPLLYLDLVGLTDAASETGLSARLFPASAFDGGAISTRFGDAYVASGVWVSGASMDVLTIHLAIGNGDRAIPFELVVHHPIVTFAHSSPRGATNGTIAGVLFTDEVIAALHPVAERVFCTEPELLARTNDMLEGSSDMLRDGTNAAGKSCDAISIGLGFDPEAIDSVPSEPSSVSSLPPPSCAKDAGAD